LGCPEEQIQGFPIRLMLSFCIAKSGIWTCQTETMATGGVPAGTATSQAPDLTPSDRPTRIDALALEESTLLQCGGE